MLGATHRIAGAAAGAAAALVADLPAGAACLAVLGGSLGGVVPDLDTPASRSARVVAADAAVTAGVAVAIAASSGSGSREEFAALAGVAFAAAVVGALSPWLLGRVLSHRGATHSLPLAAGAIVAASAWLAVCGCGGLCAAAGLGVAAGWLVGGIVPDALTHRGVPLLYPLSKTRWHLLPRGVRVATGGAVETSVVRPAAGVAALGLTLFLVLAPVEVRTSAAFAARGYAASAVIAAGEMLHAAARQVVGYGESLVVDVERRGGRAAR